MSNTENHQSGKKSVAAHVEHICGLGCTRVNEIIDTLENGQDCEELEGVAYDHRERVLVELKAIMAVYEGDEGGGTD
jgi:hypothetical protein